MTYLILIAPLDATDLPERIEYSDNEAWCCATEYGVHIHTIPDGSGGWNAERVVPWRRVDDYRKVPA